MPRWLGPGLVGLGLLVAVIGVVGTVSAGDSDAAETAQADTTTSTTAAASTSTAAPASTTTTTTVPATTTTTAAPTTTTSTTTTTTIPSETVEAFIAVFSAALESGDAVFVKDRLHPVVYENWGDELCDAWIDREIMQLSSYELINVVDGPLGRSLNTPNGSVTVADYFTANVSFVFQGQSFNSESGFALVGTDMHWLGQCR